MKFNFRSLLYFFGGAGVGCFGTYMFMNNRINNAIDDAVAEKDLELDELSEYYEDKIKKSMSTNSANKNKAPDVEAIDDAVKPADPTAVPEDVQTAVAKYKGKKKNKEEKLVTKVVAANPDDIRIITLDQYANSNYDQVTLYVYLGQQYNNSDLVVVDDDENVIDYWPTLIGEGAIYDIDFGDTLFVENSERECVYEVVKIRDEFVPSGGF